MARRTEPAEIGDNSVHNVSGDALKQLHSLTERIMNLFNERDEINADVREVFQEAADSGFDKKALRATIQRKRRIDKNADAYAANEEQIQAYFNALWQPDLFEDDDKEAAE